VIGKGCKHREMPIAPVLAPILGSYLTEI